MKSFSITIIGAGSYGTALAITLARNKHKVLLWGRNPSCIRKLEKDRSNQTFLPNILFPKNLLLESDLEIAVNMSKNILLVIPSNVFGDVLKDIKPYLRKDSRVIWATKGLEKDTGRLLQEVACEILGNKVPLAVLSGPTFAIELAKGMPTAISIASNNDKFCNDLQEIFYCCKNFRVYKNSDMIGIQLGGAVKNVIAIGSGISDGMGFGANARAALITRGLAEMSRLGIALGADLSSFIGMSGIGDLVLSCTNNQSRNRRFGLMLGIGIPATEAEKKIGQVVEGYKNTKEVYQLAKNNNIEMPITEQIYKILYCKKKILDAVRDLFERPIKNENL
ncbi:Glycerol-3-phosphate dehydrogenase [NAD(P)+] [Candidatus Providencia siddallii]|uniref:Glycerol-3-phosphate dehydrogenase [NAD(P)+] n=1 Tax=Candidatus Providencia siddallii TaxID=1715285 RepID=A0A0M6W7V4_9GAMM|nr:Glycerol-3-phosphate dehydrogenase [NAD(P)+] [Candidatus Providencia siddallii]